nr:unnamed protein product [Callosobruchus chinensis]
MWKILCAGSAERQLKLRNTSFSIVLPCAEEEARIWKLSRKRETGEHSPMHHTVRKEARVGLCLNPRTFNRVISTATICRRVLASGLTCRRPLRVPLLTARHRTARLQWARAHQDWLLPQWRNVLFSDESRFGLVSDDYRERVWRERGGQNRLATAIDERPVLPYAPGEIESVVENEGCQIYWNYSFPTLELKTMFVIEFSAPAEVNIVSKAEEKRTKYQDARQRC